MGSPAFGVPAKFELVEVGAFVRSPVWTQETYRISVKSNGRIVLECQSPMSGSRGYSAAKFDCMGFILISPQSSDSDGMVH
jgi:hypothetical protein